MRTQQARETVLAAVRTSGYSGMTTDEVEQNTELPNQTVSARMAELKQEGTIIPTGDKRRTRNGRYAKVWRTI